MLKNGKFTDKTDLVYLPFFNMIAEASQSIAWCDEEPNNAPNNPPPPDEMCIRDRDMRIYKNIPKRILSLCLVFAIGISMGVLSCLLYTSITSYVNEAIGLKL